MKDRDAGDVLICECGRWSHRIQGFEMQGLPAIAFSAFLVLGCGGEKPPDVTGPAPTAISVSASLAAPAPSDGARLSPSSSPEATVPPLGELAIGLPYKSCEHLPSIEANVPAELGPAFELKGFDGERLVVDADLTRVDASTVEDANGLVNVTFGVVDGVFPNFGSDTRLDLELSQEGRLVARGVYECVVLQ